MASKIEEILERVDQLTLDERSELMRRILSLKLESPQGEGVGSSHRSVLDGFKERGMIGTITDAPPDWSTDPKYMEGFGQHAE